jgi:hypothetical protein
MKHQTIDQLQSVAAVDERCPALTRQERLELWAERLERNPQRLLRALHETEYQRPNVRDGMRRDDSPISVALEEPALRASGMASDTYGEAKRFFELNDEELHRVVCYCHYGDNLSAAAAARAVRTILSGRQPGMFARIRDSMIG